MLQDLRFGLTLFRKHPVPVGISVGGLALAIGVVTSVFSLVNAAMLRPYGMDEPSSVVSVTRPIGDRMWSYWPYEQFLRMQAEATLSTVEAALARESPIQRAPAADGEAGRRILFVSGGYLSMLGGRPALGRALQPSDDTLGAPACGRGEPSLLVNSVQRRSVRRRQDGVAERSPVNSRWGPATDFTGPTEFRPSFWAPFAAFDELLLGRLFEPTTRTLVEVVARLAPGTALPAAQDQLTAITRRSKHLPRRLTQTCPRLSFDCTAPPLRSMVRTGPNPTRQWRASLPSSDWCSRWRARTLPISYWPARRLGRERSESASRWVPPESAW